MKRDDKTFHPAEIPFFTYVKPPLLLYCAFISENENDLEKILDANPSPLAFYIFSKNQKLTVLILENKETAAYHFNDLEKLKNDE